MQRAKCTRFFGRVYRNAPCGNVNSGINVRIVNIAAICAAKVLAFSERVFLCSNVITSTTSLTSISRRNREEKNSCQLSFILQEFSKLVKAPTVKLGFLSLAFWLCCFPDSSQIFYSNTFALALCFFNYSFTNSMVINGNKSTFSATKPFQEFLSSFSAFALNACSCFSIFFTDIFKFRRVELGAIGANSNIGLPKVNLKNVLVLPIFALSLHQNIFAMDKKEYLRQYHLKTYVPTGNKQGRPRELPNYDFSGIYQLKNTANGKIYVGQAQNILQRFNEHRRNRNGHLIYRDCYLYRAIKKYGWQKFEISVLEKVDDTSLLNEREIFWVNELNPKYNMKDGGGCARGWLHTEEAKRKMSETKSKQYLGENNPFYGKTHSEETKKKIAEASKNRKYSKETKLKMRAWYKSELFYKRVGKFNKETNELLCEYKSVNDAAKDNGVSQSNMSSHLGGRNKTCKGYIFKFI